VWRRPTQLGAACHTRSARVQSPCRSPVPPRFDKAVEIRYPARVHVLTRVLFAIVALQLAFGLQVATARAAYAPSAVPAASDACALHHTSPKSGDNHDCCKVSGNQCQCGSLALAFNVVPAMGTPDLPTLSSGVVVPPVNAPPESRFRPPIAS